MSQAWLQVIGLVVEFLGVLLLAWEWFTAQRQEHAERALVEDQSRREDGMAMMARAQAGNETMQRHFEMTRDVQRRMTASRAAETRRRYGGLRARAVALSLVMVTLGFALQLLGSWPDCCRLIGVVPLG